MIRERDLPKRGGAAVLDAELATALGRKTISFKTMGRTIEGLVKSARDLVGYDTDGNWVGQPVAEAGSESGSDDDDDDDAGGSDDDDDKAAAPRAASAKASGRAAKRGRSGAAPSAAAPAKRTKGKTGLSGGAVVLCDELARLTGARVTSRSQVSKWLWSRIRARGLQNPSDRRKVTYDDALGVALRCKTATIFTMNRHISNAVRKATPEEAEEAVAELRMEAATDADEESHDGEEDQEGDEQDDDDDDGDDGDAE